MEMYHCVYFDYWGSGTKVTVTSGKTHFYVICVITGVFFYLKLFLMVQKFSSCIKSSNDQVRVDK